MPKKDWIDKIIKSWSSEIIPELDIVINKVITLDNGKQILVSECEIDEVAINA